MISKNIRVGMKVIPISKSVGQSFESWKELHQSYRERRGDGVALEVQKWDKNMKCWACIIDSGALGYFLPKDLIEYQE